MTNTQAARLEGWRLGLIERGHSVQLQPSGPTFSAMVASGSSDSMDHKLEAEVENTSRISIAREDVGSTSIVIGSVFYDSANTRYLRVTKIQKQLTDVLNHYICEDSDPV